MQFGIHCDAIRAFKVLSTNTVLKLRTFVLFFTVVAAAHADWKVLSLESEPGRAGIEHRHIVVENTAADQRTDLDLAIFSAKSCTVRVIDNPDGQTLAAVMKREKCGCGENRKIEIGPLI